MKVLTFALGMTFATLTPAATHEHDMAQHAAAVQTASQAYEASGVLKEADAAKGRLKIAHEPIATLHWPAMTMWFQLRGTLPQDLHAGDRVQFEIEQQQEQWVITRIERSR